MTDPKDKRIDVTGILWLIRPRTPDGIYLAEVVVTVGVDRPPPSSEETLARRVTDQIMAAVRTEVAEMCHP